MDPAEMKDPTVDLSTCSLPTQNGDAVVAAAKEPPVTSTVKLVPAQKNVAAMTTPMEQEQEPNTKLARALRNLQTSLVVDNSSRLSRKRGNRAPLPTARKLRATPSRAVARRKPASNDNKSSASRTIPKLEIATPLNKETTSAQKKKTQTTSVASDHHSTAVPGTIQSTCSSISAMTSPAPENTNNGADKGVACVSSTNEQQKVVIETPPNNATTAPKPKTTVASDHQSEAVSEQEPPSSTNSCHNSTTSRRFEASIGTTSSSCHVHRAAAGQAPLYSMPSANKDSQPCGEPTMVATTTTTPEAEKFIVGSREPVDQQALLFNECCSTKFFRPVVVASHHSATNMEAAGDQPTSFAIDKGHQKEESSTAATQQQQQLSDKKSLFRPIETLGDDDEVPPLDGTNHHQVTTTTTQGRPLAVRTSNLHTSDMRTVSVTPDPSLVASPLQSTAEEEESKDSKDASLVVETIHDREMQQYFSDVLQFGGDPAELPPIVPVLFSNDGYLGDWDLGEPFSE